MDLKELTDEELNEHRVAVATECERRANLAAIPEQIKSLAGKYREGGGDEDTLRDALTPEQAAALED